MALQTYRKKRDFERTSEPRGRTRKKKGNSFVIQKHAARRLHYDLRLEMDGAYKSWAVTKGPSLIAGEKRLAVHVEDHPLDYGTFEGTIPKGEYGGGTVIVWDRGSWNPVHDAAKGYAKGHLEFELQGEKLHGRWHLVKMARKSGEKRENWLLIKADDDAARPEGAKDILDEEPRSVQTGRLIEEVAAGKKPDRKTARKTAPSKMAASARKAPSASRSKEERPSPPADQEASLPDPARYKGSKAAALPDFIEPVLASLLPGPPAGDQWIHEIKFDGYRLIARLEAKDVRLLTRSGLDWTGRFGSAVADALKDLPAETAMLDGELVVENDAGASDFSALQADLSEGRADRFIYYAFDLLHLNGYDLCDLPLIERKAMLEQLLAGPFEEIRYSGHFAEDGKVVLRHACRLSLEGIISKRADSPYRPGRSKVWIKSKCASRQEFVIGGYKMSSTSKNAIGSLVLGVYENGALVHVGRVGTGFTRSVAEDLYRRLRPITIQKRPFAQRLSADDARGVRYVKPELVAEAEFRSWTADGSVRHASFRGLREDKPPMAVEREAVDPSPARRRVAGRSVRLTHQDRVYWPDAGVTKEGLADYYAEVWPFMAPFVSKRPLSLLRCPEGIGRPSFFQKHGWKGLDRNIVLVLDPKDEDDEPLISINDLDGLTGLVQGAALEIHPWGSTVADWERPDMIVMDLDPGDDVSWTRVIEAALDIQDRLETAGFAAFVKTSGGKGLHVVAPLKPRASWPVVKAFTKKLADSMAADSPGRYVANVSKAKRKGKILVDYLRNQRGATAIAPYSSRARSGAPVSMPLAWEELGPGLGPAYFTVLNAPARLGSLAGDPWADFRKAAAPLERGKAKKAA